MMPPITEQLIAHISSDLLQSSDLVFLPSCIILYAVTQHDTRLPWRHVGWSSFDAHPKPRACGFFSTGYLAIHQLVSTVPRQLIVVLTRLKFLEPAGEYAKSLARSLCMSPQCPLYFYPERKTHSVGLRSMFLLFPSISSHEAGIVS